MNLPDVKSKNRIKWMLMVFSVLIVILLGRVFFWQIIRADWLMEKALDQWTSEKPVAATRGSILDRDGNTLAQSVSSYMVLVRPKEISAAQKKLNTAAEKEGTTAPDLKTDISNDLSTILGLDYAFVYKRVADTEKSEVLIKRQISREQRATILTAEMTGVHLSEDKTRSYATRNFLSQVLGFTSIDGEGLEGIEARYDKYLRGKAGSVASETDARQQELPNSVDVYVPPVDGNHVRLTIDSVIQTFAEQAVEQCVSEQNAKNATMIIMNPKTGEILSIACKPDYDNNAPPRNDGELLATLMRNTAVADAYEPGSTFKILTLAAGLDSGAITTGSEFYCPGYHIVDGEKIKCWSVRAHGSQSLTQAAQNSCNPAFMQTALRMGRDKFYEYLYAFGLGSKTDIDLYGETGGIVTEPKYVRNVDLARIGFGHAIAMSPLQLITAVSAAVNGGNLMQPYIAAEITDAQTGASVLTNQPRVVRNVITPEVSAQLREILTAVVDNGSGRNGAVPGYSVGGKTGTAQKYDENGRVMHDKHVSSFISFAPADDPQIIILLVVDEPNVAVDYGSIVAAPYVKQVMENSLKYIGVKPDRADGVAGEEKTVPNTMDMEVEQAMSALQGAGFKCEIEGYAGKVVAQLPAADATAASGSTVVIYLEQPTDVAEEVTVPDLTGKTAVEANTILQELGLRLKITGTGSRVYSQKPAQGTVVAKGETIELVFRPDPTPAP